MAMACGGADVDRTPVGGDAAPPADAFVLPDVQPEATFEVQFVDPDHGSFRGGTDILVRGKGFTSATRIEIGGRAVDPLDLEFIDSRRIRVLTPAGDPGLADVVAVQGAERATLAQTYTYEAIDVTPPAGSVAGGTFVTVTGLGTDFDADTVVTFDGAPLTNVTVLTNQSLTGTTPPGVSGTANVLAITSSGAFEARKAFTYNSTGDPFGGGMGGGPIMDTINVTVIDSRTDNGVDNALVAIGDPFDTELIGRADGLGQITFSQPGLRGPITVTAAADGYETQQFVSYDATNISIFLVSKVRPEPNGPIPPGRLNGRIFGHIVFGGPTGIGIETWNLVPEPRTPTEVKRVYVTTTASSPYRVPFAPLAPIDFDPAETGKVAWAYEVVARPGAMAIVAVAGLYDPARDPSGTGVTGFEPFAMGVARGVLIGPGESKVDVDVVIDIPLDTAVEVDLIDPPRLNSPGQRGPTFYRVQPFLDFGGEGVIAMNKNGLPIPPTGEARPNYYELPEGDTSIVLSGMAPLTGPIVDGSYTFIAGAYSQNGSNPYSVRVERGVRDVQFPVEIGDFLGTTRAVDPAPGGVASADSIEIAPEPPPTGEATFHVHLLGVPGGDPLYRIFANAPEHRLAVPDVGAFGLTPLPRDKDVDWTFYSLRIPGTTFDQFSYRQLNINYWSAYSVDATAIQFPDE